MKTVYTENQAINGELRKIRMFALKVLQKNISLVSNKCSVKRARIIKFDTYSKVKRTISEAVPSRYRYKKY